MTALNRTKSANPISLTDRLVGLDVLRGFALYGVLLTNAFVSARPIEIALRPPIWDPTDESGGLGVATKETLAWAIFDGLLVTKFVALFSLLFGMGLVLQNQRAEASGLPFASIYRRRLSILAVIGIFHGCLLFEGDILFVYSVVGALLFLFRDRSAKTLFRLSLIPFAIGLILSLIWAAFDLEAMLAQLDQSDPSVEDLSRPETVGQLLAIRPFEFLGWLLISSLISFNWRVVAFFFIGAAIMKSGWIQANFVNLQRRVGLTGLAIGLTLESIGMCCTLSSEYSSAAIRIVIAVCDEFGSVILSFGYAGIVLWLVHTGRLSWLRRGLAAVGRTALTNYLLQSVAMNVVFASFMMGLYDKLTRVEVLVWFSAVFVTQIVGSTLWLRFFAMGPVEWVWRSLTYRRL